MFALLLRPKKEHKHRKYWNVYHHLVGYAVIILGAVNIFKGFDALKPEKKWKHAYIGILIALGINFLWLEACTWFIVLRRRRSQSAEKVSYGYGNGNGNGFGTGGTNGGSANGYGGRPHHNA